jgi:hypothetical protein
VALTPRKTSKIQRRNPAEPMPEWLLSPEDPDKMQGKPIRPKRGPKSEASKPEPTLAPEFVPDPNLCARCGKPLADPAPMLHNGGKERIPCPHIVGQRAPRRLPDPTFAPGGKLDRRYAYRDAA